MVELPYKGFRSSVVYSSRCYDVLTQRYIPKGNPLLRCENVKADFTDIKSS